MRRVPLDPLTVEVHLTQVEATFGLTSIAGLFIERCSDRVVLCYFLAVVVENPEHMACSAFFAFTGALEQCEGRRNVAIHTRAVETHYGETRAACGFAAIASILVERCCLSEILRHTNPVLIHEAEIQTSDRCSKPTGSLEQRDRTTQVGNYLHARPVHDAEVVAGFRLVVVARSLISFGSRRRSVVVATTRCDGGNDCRG